MKRVPTLEDVTAQLEVQDAELTAAAELADTIPDRHIIAESLLEAFDGATEPPVATFEPPLAHAIRA